MRAFIGIDFDAGCKRNIFELQQKLRRLAVKGRWKHSDNFHLTLKFLDEINAQQQKQIDEALRGISTRHRPFSLETDALGVFPGRDSIRVLWLALAGELQQLHSISSDIDSSLAAIGFPPEKRGYTPHITIGQDILFDSPFDRIREEINYQKYGPICVKAIHLFKSEQVQSKRVYTKISEYMLKQ